MPGGKVAQIYAAGRYWVIDPDGKANELPEEGRPRSRRASSATSIARPGQGGGTARSSSARSTPTSRCWPASRSPAREMPPLTLFINRDNGSHRSRALRTARTAASRSATATTAASTASRSPFHTVVRRAGMTQHRARRQDDQVQRPARAGHVQQAELDAVRGQRLRVMLSCGEPSGDLYAGALAVRDPEARARRDRHRLRRRADAGRRRDARPRLPRSLGHRPQRSAARHPEVVADLSRAGAAPPRRSRPTSSCRSTFPTSTRFSRARCTGAACPSSTTSARSCGRGGRAASRPCRRVADRVLVIFPFEVPFYEQRERAGHVRRASAARADAADAAA